MQSIIAGTMQSIIAGTNVYLLLVFILVTIIHFSMIIFLLKKHKRVKATIGNLVIFQNIISQIFWKEINDYLNELKDISREIANQYRDMNSGGTTSSPISDLFLKQDISYNIDKRHRLNAIKPVKFRYIEDNPYGLDSSLRYGFLAQDLEKVLPMAVKRNTDGFLCIDTNCIVAILVKTVNDLQNEVEDLKKRD